MNPCLLIPIYDHGGTIEAVITELQPLGLPCLVVDDGSGPETQRSLARVAERFSWVSVSRRPQNGGRGAALQDGYHISSELGFTHALQIDADGQHDPAAVPFILQSAA